MDRLPPTHDAAVLQLVGQQWRVEAACAGRGDLFWPETNNLADRRRLQAEAADVCAGYPVRGPCADYAATHVVIGMWAGERHAPKL